MADASVGNNPWAAAACWAGAPFSGGLVPVVFLIVTWNERGSLTRRHALAASVLWVSLIAIYVPVFVIGMFIPAFQGEPPRPWAMAIAVAFFVTSWIATIVGCVAVFVATRRDRPTVGEPPLGPSGAA